MRHPIYFQTGPVWLAPRFETWETWRDLTILLAQTCSLPSLAGVLWAVALWLNVRRASIGRLHKLIKIAKAWSTRASVPGPVWYHDTGRSSFRVCAQRDAAKEPHRPVKVRCHANSCSTTRQAHRRRRHVHHRRRPKATSPRRQHPRHSPSVAVASYAARHVRWKHVARCLSRVSQRHRQTSST